MLAAHALVDGCASPSLRELAGVPRRSNETEIRELYVRVLTHSAYLYPTRRQPADTFS